MGGWHSVRALKIGLVLLGLAAAGGCSQQAFEPAVGRCFDVKGGEIPDWAEMMEVPCDQPHRGEVVGLYEPVGGPYPGTDLLGREAADHCAKRFTEYVGSNPVESVLDLYPLIPTRTSWEEDGDKQVVCAVQLPGDLPLTKSIKDSERPPSEEPEEEAESGT